MKNSGPHKPAHPHHQRLSELRDALLALHKAVVDSEKISYEQTVGKIHCRRNCPSLTSRHYSNETSR